MESTVDKVLKSIQRMGRGAAFSGKDFLKLANRASVDKALSVLSKAGTIRRVFRGLYDYPRFNERLGGELSPDVDQVVHAVARKSGRRIEATGAWAANLLGLSTQLPARVVYLTDGLSRTVVVGKQEVEFRHVEPRTLAKGRPTSGLVVQALRHLGSEHIDAAVIKRIRSALSERDRRALLTDTQYTTDWIYEHVKAIARERRSADE